MLAAVVIWAAYTLLLKRRPTDLTPTVTLAGSMRLGAALMLPVAFLTLPMAQLLVTPGTLGALAYIFVFPSILAFWLWGYGVARMGTERAGQFVHLMPVFGPVLAMAIVGERVVTAQVGGAVIIFAELALVIRRPKVLRCAGRHPATRVRGRSALPSPGCGAEGPQQSGQCRNRAAP